MSDTRSARPSEILLVEDNAADTRLTLEALKDAKLANEIHAVTDGIAALEHLRRQGAYASAVPPDLILLDLGLPRKSGLEVLAEIKEDPELRRIPVVILTGSQAEQDIIHSYNLHANCYVSKPVGLDPFQEIMRAVEEFWFAIVKLPKG